MHSFYFVDVLHDQTVHIHMHFRRGEAEQPRWNTAMHVNVLEPFHEGTAPVRRWLEMVTGHYCVCTQHFIIVLWKLIVLVVYKSVSVLALLRVVTPFLHFDEAIALRD